MEHLYRKYRQLSISLVIGILSVVLSLLLSQNAIYTLISGRLIEGTVVEYSVTSERPTHYNVSQRTPELHTIYVEYCDGNELKTTSVNAHLYAAFGVVKFSDSLLLGLPKEKSYQPIILTYALYSPMVSVLFYLQFLILFVVFPQWLVTKYKIKKRRQLTV